MSERGHRVVPHTADVILEAWGPDLVGCAAQAVRALVATYVEVPGAPVLSRRQVHLGPAPAEELLVGVLEEVIFTLDTEEEVPVGAQIATSPEGGWDVEILLADPHELVPTGAVPKAVARSELQVEVGPGTVRCRFLVDV